MKLKHILFTSLFVSAFGYNAQAQFVGDALLFSQQNNGGTARFKGLGNVNTALGGDISSITGNPAGLGFFGQSDMSVTLNYNNANNKASYFGENTSSNKGKLGIDHAGAVFHFPSYNPGNGWQSFSVGLSYENTNSFDNRLRYSGINPNNTIANNYADRVMLDPLSYWGTQMRNTKIVEVLGNNANDYFPIASETADKNQVNDILNKGFNSRTAIAFGGNYNNKLYIGATIGMSAFRYETSNQFSESGWTKDRAAIIADNPNSTIADPTHPDNQFENKNYELLDDYYQINEGTGIDFKLGVIYKPSTDWNIGATITTPTWSTVDEFSENYFQADYYVNEGATKPFITKSIDSLFTEDTYRIISPWKFSLGITKFFNRGLLTADAEYINYSALKVRTAGYRDIDLENKWDSEVKNDYQSTLNFRVGGEVLFTNILSGRAGFNYVGNPHKNADNTQYNGSLGLGIKLSSSMYMDLAVIHQVNEYKISAYTLDTKFWNTSAPIVDVKHQRTNAVLTLGAKF